MSQNEMSSNRKMVQRRKVRRKKQRAKSNSTYLLIILGIAAFSLLLYFVPRLMLTQDKFEYRQEDIAYGESIHAVHEMDGSKLYAIPFYPAGSPQPKIQASHLFVDLGSIGADEVVTHEIAIKNVGDAPLIVSRAYTTCGCTTAHITASELQPGDVVLVTITLDAGYHDVRGQTVRRGVVIESNDPDNPELIFWMEASVRTTP